MSRPEHQAPPEIFYNEDEAAKYSSNSHIQEIQRSLTQRALELLLLPPHSSALLLDLGCGSGISGDILTETGHHWIGLDISRSMLDVALEREVEGDLIVADLGQLSRFRPGSFDGAISISAIQWLCNADRKSHVPYQRLRCFFKWLYDALNRGARAVLQFYPENGVQLEMLTSAALRSGFGGGVVVDFPNSTRAKKHFLVLWAGFTAAPPSLPQGLCGDEEEDDAPQQPSQVRVEAREGTRHLGKRRRAAVKDREWVLHKKEGQRRLGKDVRPDTKYTGRKRKNPF